MQAEGIVYIVDDDASVADAITRLLESVGLRSESFTSAQQFLEHGRHDRPSCLVLDVRLPGVSGLDLQRELNRAGVGIPTIFVTGHGDVPMSVQAMKGGALEFLTKPFRDQQLLDCVQQALECDRVARVVRAERAELQRRVESLTPRERHVMQLVLAGLLNKQIATRVGASEVTVKVRRGRMMAKMKAKSVMDLAHIAERLGLAASDPAV
jgi:FixJ family two-component response regulator